MMNFINGFLKIVYPEEHRCAFCSKQLKDRSGILCAGCASLLAFINDNICSNCGRPLPPGSIPFVCSECSNRDMHFDGGCMVFEFDGLVQDILHRLKYGGEAELAQTIGWFMSSKLKKMNWTIDVIMPVPLHPDRLKERGFNQSHLLADAIGWECGIDVNPGVLIRDRNTESQVGLTRMERMHNVRGAFTVNGSGEVRGKRILLVDDIMTTGSTLDECSRALKEHGANKVYFITAACPAFV